VQFRDLLGERQSQTGAVVLAVERTLELHERLDHARNVRLRNADAGVDAAYHPGAVLIADEQAAHRAARRRELDGVAENVDEDLFDQGWIDPHDRVGVLRRSKRQPHAAFRCPLPKEAEALAEDRENIHLLLVQGESADFCL
jgi:hypothetical protein